MGPVLLFSVFPVVPGHLVILLTSLGIRDIAEEFGLVREPLFLALPSERPLLFFESLFFDGGGLQISVFKSALIWAQPRVRRSDDFGEAFRKVVQIEDEIRKVILPGTFLG